MGSLRLTGILSMLLLGLLCLTFIPKPVVALGCIPEEFYGSVKVNGDPAPDGSQVAAISGGTMYGNTTTSRGQYTVTVGPIQFGCPLGGSTVNFSVFGVLADQSATFSMGSSQSLNLTVSILDFTFSITPSSQVVRQGQTLSYNVTVPSFGFQGEVMLSISGLPPQTTGTFMPNPVTPPASGNVNATLIINTSGSTPVGTYTLQVEAQRGSYTRTAQASLIVVCSCPRSFRLNVNPTSNTGPQGGQATFTVNVTSLNSFAEPVLLKLTGTPSGVTYGFFPNPLTPVPNTSTLATLMINVSSSAALAAYNLTVVANSSSELHTFQIFLGIVSSILFTPLQLILSVPPLQLIVSVSLASLAHILTRRHSVSHSRPPQKAEP